MGFEPRTFECRPSGLPTQPPIIITITLYGSPCYMAEQNTMQNDITPPGKGD